MPPEITPAPEADPFTAAFAHLASLGDTPPGDTPPAAAAPEETVAGGEDTAPAAETPAGGEDTAPAAETVEGGPQPEPAPAADTISPTASDDALLGRLGEILARAKVPEAPAPASQPAPEAPPQPEIYTPEEKAALESYEKDWPDVARAEALRRRQEYHLLTAYIFDQVRTAMGPLAQTVATLADRGQLSDLQTVVPDYDDIRDRVVEWVGTQPSYLKSAYEHVIKQGTVDEVADLIARYKREAAPPPPAPAAAPRKAPELPPAAKKAAAEMAPVGSKLSAVTTGLDPNDFGAAFAEFADKV